MRGQKAQQATQKEEEWGQETLTRPSRWRMSGEDIRTWEHLPGTVRVKRGVSEGVQKRPWTRSEESHEVVKGRTTK